MFWSVLSHNWLGNDQGLAKKRTGTKSSMENNMAASDFGNETENFFEKNIPPNFRFFSIFSSKASVGEGREATRANASRQLRMARIPRARGGRNTLNLYWPAKGNIPRARGGRNTLNLYWPA